MHPDTAKWARVARPGEMVLPARGDTSVAAGRGSPSVARPPAPEVLSAYVHGAIMTKHAAISYRRSSPPKAKFLLPLCRIACRKTRACAVGGGPRADWNHRVCRARHQRHTAATRRNTKRLGVNWRRDSAIPFLPPCFPYPPLPASSHKQRNGNDSIRAGGVAPIEFSQNLARPSKTQDPPCLGHSLVITKGK